MSNSFKTIAGPCSVLLFLLTIFSGCAGPNSFESPKYYFSTMTRLEVEVAYEPDAEPYTGSWLAGGNQWDFTKNNIEAILAARSTSVTISVPEALSEMTLIPDQNKSTFTADEIRAISKAYRKGSSTAEKANFFIVFLSGYFDVSGTLRQGTAGVRVTGTNIIALFKPAIRSSQLGPTDETPKFVEQSTIVHEIGHLFGLVNNGIPMTVNHEDTGHPHHCTNTTCVMYWANEGISDIKLFMDHYLTTGDVFGVECMDDIKGYSPAPKSKPASE